MSDPVSHPIDPATFVNGLGKDRNAWQAQARRYEAALRRIADHGGTVRDGIVGDGAWCATQAREALDQP